MRERTTSFAVLALLAALLLSSCSSGPESKAPAESQFAASVIDMLKSIESTYEAKDFDSLGRFFEGDALAEVRRDMKDFEKVELDITPQWMELGSNEQAYVRASWSGKWTIKGQARSFSGSVIFDLSASTPPKIIAIRNSNPLSFPR